MKILDAGFIKMNKVPWLSHYNRTFQKYVSSQIFLLESKIQFSGGNNRNASGRSRLIIRWEDIAYFMPQKSSNFNSYENHTVEIGTEINNLITSALQAKMIFHFVKSRLVSVSSVQKTIFVEEKLK